MDTKKLDKWADLLLDAGNRTPLINRTENMPLTIETSMTATEVPLDKDEETMSALCRKRELWENGGKNRLIQERKKQNFLKHKNLEIALASILRQRVTFLEAELVSILQQ